ncbi:MAG TPA: Na+/H+ antiporter [Casimicrobiaceae bacterium]|nr:Na+/H+ antiporter [Casimicrobiaceae bacterium]
MSTIPTILILLAVLALTSALGKRVPVPAPLLLIVAGIGMSFVPGFEKVEIEPHVFFLLFIPPLLFADGWLIPKRELRNVIRPVLLLAFGLVFMTIFGVGLLIHWLIPSLPIAAAFALGAIVSPTDAVATSAMVQRANLPRRVTNILNGESLINDASGLVAFRFAVAALATGTYSAIEIFGDLLLVSIGGALIGVAIAWAIGKLRVALRNHCADDPSVQTVLSILTPFAAHLAAEHFQLSGILAVVAGGLYAGWNDFRTLDARTRQHAWEVWMMLLFVFNGLVFILLGISLTHALTQLGGADWHVYVGYAFMLWAALTALRLIWVFPSAYLPQLVSRRIRERNKFRDPRQVFLVGWAGLRGSVTMAAALSIPLTLAGGEPFPERHLVVFLAASTIVLTLLINGLTLSWLVHAFRLPEDRVASRDRRIAEIALAQAATAALEREIATVSRPDEIAQARELMIRYARHADRHTANADRLATLVHSDANERRLSMLALEAQRRELYALLDAGTISDGTLRDIEARLDNAELSALGPSRMPRH